MHCSCRGTLFIARVNTIWVNISIGTIFGQRALLMGAIYVDGDTLLSIMDDFVVGDTCWDHFFELYETIIYEVKGEISVCLMAFNIL